MQKKTREATTRLRVWVATEVFSVAIELPGSVSRHGSLCCNMVPKLQAVVGSRQGFSCSRQRFFLLVFCCDRSPPCVKIVFCSLS